MTSSPRARLLVVDDEAAQMKRPVRHARGRRLRNAGFTSARQALEHLATQEFDLLLTDLMMPEMDGIALLRAAQEIDRDLAGVVMTGHGTIDTAVQAMQGGALDYILKPFRLNAVLPVLAKALATRRLQTENIQLRETLVDLRAVRRHHAWPRSRGRSGEDARRRVPLSRMPRKSRSSCPSRRRAAHGRGHARAAFHPTARHCPSLATRTSRSGSRARAGNCRMRKPPAIRLGVRASAAVICATASRCRCWRAARWRASSPFSSVRPRERITLGQVKALGVLASTAGSALGAASLWQQLRAANRELEQRVEERTRDLVRRAARGPPGLSVVPAERRQ